MSRSRHPGVSQVTTINKFQASTVIHQAAQVHFQVGRNVHARVHAPLRASAWWKLHRMCLRICYVVTYSVDNELCEDGGKVIGAGAEGVVVGRGEGGETYKSPRCLSFTGRYRRDMHEAAIAYMIIWQGDGGDVVEPVTEHVFTSTAALNACGIRHHIVRTGGVGANLPGAIANDSIAVFE
jgi:hypothetical protein